MRGGRNVLYLFIFFLTMINYADRVALSIGSKEISEEFHLTPIQMGYLLSSFTWTYVLFLIPWGAAVDRVGPRLVTMVGMGLWSTATVITGFAFNLASLFGARMLMGASESSAFPSVGRLIRSWVPRSNFGFANTVAISGGYAGPAVGAIAFGWLASIFGWRGGFAIVGCSGFIWILLAAFWFHKPADTSAPTTAAAAPDDAVRKDELGTLAGFGQLLASPSLWGLFLTQGACVYAHYLHLTWLPNYLQTTKHLTMMTTGLFTGLPFGISVFFSLALSILSDRILGRGGDRTGKRRWMVALMMVFSASIALLPFVDNIWIIVAIFTVALTATSTATGLNSALLTDLLASPSDAGKGHAVLIIGGNTFGTLAPIVTGYVVANTGGFDATWYFCSALLIVGAVIVMSFTRGTIGVARDDEPTSQRIYASL
jgi:ACS family glucarate transporter-like MFS transporter